MAGSKVNDYSIADVNFTALMATVDAQRQGYMKVSLTNYDNNSKPDITEGSKIEVNGALYEFTSDETPGGAPADGPVFIKVIPAAATCTAELTATLPVWDDEKGGWYESATNNRYLHFVMEKSGVNFYAKNDMYKPTGRIVSWVNAYTPLGWLLCDGSTLDSVANTEYARLYHIIGTTFGGTGADDFDLPDLRGRVIAGKDNMGGVSANILTNAQADVLGGIAGTENHTLIEAELPAHTHSLPSLFQETGTAIAPVSGSKGAFGINSTGSVGSNNPHNNAQPYMALNYIIQFI